jgi:hypothetical protein
MPSLAIVRLVEAPSRIPKRLQLEHIQCRDPALQTFVILIDSAME